VNYPLVNQLLSDSESVFALLSMEDEQDSQASYEDFTAQTSATIKAKQSEVDGKMKEILLVGDFRGDSHFPQTSHETPKHIGWMMTLYTGHLYFSCSMLKFGVDQLPSGSLSPIYPVPMGSRA
jgi:hypothetical protein